MQNIITTIDKWASEKPERSLTNQKQKNTAIKHCGNGQTT